MNATKDLIGFGETHFYDNFIPSQSFLLGKLSSVKVVGMYIFKFLFPIHLLVDYSYPTITPVTKLLDFNLMHFSFYVLLCLSPLLLKIKNNFAALGSLFFFTCISFVSNFFFQIGTIMGERLMYLPSLGLSILLVSSLNIIFKNIFKSNPLGDRFFVVIMLILCIAFGSRTMLRNKDWTTSQNLWDSTIATTDKSFRAYNNRANIFIDKKDFTSARNDLFKSLDIYKDYYTTTYSIGRTFDGENSIDSAITYYTKSIQDKPYFYMSRINRGIDLLDQKEYEKAIEDFDVCSQLKPQEFFPWFNKAVAYFENEKYKQSKIAVEKAIEIDPKSEKSQILLGRIFLAEKNYLEAEKVFKTLPENAETLFYLGYSKIMSGEKEESVIMLKKSIALYPAVKKTILEAKEFTEIWYLIK